MTEPLTPQQKVEYLASKLEGTALEVQAVTGLHVCVDIHVFDTDTPRKELAGVIASADDLGAVKHEWTHAAEGGYYHFDLNGGDLYLNDAQMVHEPKLSPIVTGPEDQQVLGFEGAVESLVLQ